MQIHDSVIVPLPGTPASAVEGTGTPASASASLPAATSPRRFSQVLATVKRGDTLIGMVKSQFRSQGLSVSDNQAWRLAHRVAADNRLADANRIEPGQQLNLGAVQETTDARLAARASLMASLANPVSNPAPKAGTSAAGATPQAAASAPTAERGAPGPHAVLEKTLQRAVDKGHLRADQVGAVRERIFSMAAHYGFEPDDFARLTIMESGGMNPLASNGRCHGIIQFCDGPARGAAAVGYGAKPRAILKLDLLQQLDLVDKYFEHTGLDRFGPKISLDDLYLTVLQPSARAEVRRDKPLAIAGPQAAYLHMGHNTRAPITRESIVAGLHQFSNQLLGAATTLADTTPALPSSPAPTVTSQRLAQLGQRFYTQSDVSPDETLLTRTPR